MIRYLHNSAIDKQKWDACIRGSRGSVIYAYAWYLDKVSDHWDALVLDDYRAVMPIPYTKKAGIALALQPLFCQQLGVFSNELLTADKMNEFIRAVPRRFRWVHLYMNYRNELDGSSLRTNYVLNLSSDITTLRTRYQGVIMRNIRKSEKSTCEIREGIPVAGIMHLFDWQNRKKNLGLSSAALSRFENLLNTASAKGALYSLGLYSPQNELCAVSVFLKDHRRIYYVLGAMNDTGRQYSGLYRLVDKLIEREAGKELTLDFEGSQIEGIASFFQKFGAENEPYPVFHREGLGPMNFLLRKKFR